MKKNNIKKSTTKKLVRPAVKGKKSAKNQKLTAVLATRKATANRNSFRRALYRANKMIASGNSFYKNKLSMKEFKSEYQLFNKRTGMLNGKNLDENLKTFLYNEISNRTPKQCKSAVDNLMKHLNDAVSALNGLEGDIDFKGDIKGLSNTNNKYIKVLIKAKALKIEEKDGKKVYSIIEEKLPNSADLITVNNKYLNIKRIIIEYFGDEEYAEAYGS